MSLIDIAFCGLIFWMVFYQWPEMVLDTTRQKLFKIRDQVFDDSLLNKPSARPAYRLIREDINGLIRMTHMYSLLQVVATMIFFKPIKPSKTIDEELQVFDLSVEDREKLKINYESALLIVAFHVVQRSLLLSLSFGIATRIFIGVKPWFGKTVSNAAAIEAKYA